MAQDTGSPIKPTRRGKAKADSAPQNLPRRSTRTRSNRSANTQPEAPDVFDETDPQETPKATRVNSGTKTLSTTSSVYAKAFTSELTLRSPGPSSLSSKSSLSKASSTPSKRSSSPVKRPTQLQDLAGGVSFKDLGGNAHYFGNYVEDIELDEPVMPHQEDNDDSRTKKELLVEFDEVQQIVKRSRQCKAEMEHEAEWNYAVHGRALRLAVGDKSDRVDVRYVPSAAIHPNYLPGFSTDLAASSKMIDFVMFIDDDDGQAPGDQDTLQVSQASPRLANLFPLSTNSVNHTTYNSLRHRPIAVSIETKIFTRAESEACIQLAVWVTSQINRIWELSNEFKKPAVQSILAEMVFPLLWISSAQWNVYLARPLLPASGEKKDLEVVVYGPMVIGDTSTLLRTYQLLRGLRVLERWADTDFRGFWARILETLTTIAAA
ncbi:hypothetical protein CDV31_017138 [Fusarium ambrosium]|uniref:PD-(D/E)XK nuclease-like domain-containing protein n=1 Tax=Fusarium ambrosium TaxID=131363 RepID=A0A428RRN9_9HYPO|nr:hypothetical protein CDV31_017138 [Fusarium ambrosium]